MVNALRGGVRGVRLGGPPPRVPEGISMRLLRDLWATVAAPHRGRGRARSCSAPAGQAGRARRWPVRCWCTARHGCSRVLAVALVVAVLSDLVVGADHGPAHRRLVGRRPPPAVPGRVRPGPADAGDHPGRRAARPHRRRRLPGRLRAARQRRADRPVAGASASLSIVTALCVWWPAGVAMLRARACCSAVALRRPTAADRARPGWPRRRPGPTSPR